MVALIDVVAMLGCDDYLLMLWLCVDMVVMKRFCDYVAKLWLFRNE